MQYRLSVNFGTLSIFRLSYPLAHGMAKLMDPTIEKKNPDPTEKKTDPDRWILNLDVRTGSVSDQVLNARSGFDQVLKTGSGSYKKHIRIRNPSIETQLTNWKIPFGRCCRCCSCRTWRTPPWPA